MDRFQWTIRLSWLVAVASFLAGLSGDPWVMLLTVGIGMAVVVLVADWEDR